jgi:protein-disulfide isomerase
MRHTTLFVLVLLVVLAAAACDNGTSTPPTMVAPTVSKYTAMPSDAEMLAEKVIGNASAPTTIYEYVSMWCTGCQSFHATVEPQIKAQFVDTGKARLVFRNLFLSSEMTPAAANPNGVPVAPMLARCVGNADFFSAIDYIFTTQSAWLSNSDPNAALKSRMLAFGMSQSLEDSCLSDAALATGLGQVHNDALAQTYQVLLADGTTAPASAAGFTHVPAVVINGVKLDSTTADNAPTLENIAKLIK